MQFNKEILIDAAKNGSKKVADSFSKLSGTKVKVNVSSIQTFAIKSFLEKIKPSEKQAVVVYAQLLYGIKGVSVLILSRESALTLIDLLNQQPMGTTSILKNIDRSAIKETLNILSNSYINALSESAHIDLRVDVPRLITSQRLDDLTTNLVEKKNTRDEKVIALKTTLTALDQKIKASLHIIFNENFMEIMKKEPNI